MPRRRELIFGAGALALAGGGRALGATAADRTAAAVLTRHMDEYLAMSPEAAASLLADARGRAARFKLDDASPAEKARKVQAARRWRAELQALDRRALSPAMAVDYDSAAFAYEMLAEMGPLYGFQDHALRPGPYVVSQMTGAYYWLPQNFARAPVAHRDEADAYLSRLAAFAEVLDGETARIRQDAAAGATPPDFIIDRTIAQLSDLRGGAPEASTLVAGPSSRSAAAGLSDVGPAALQILTAKVFPALDRQISALAGLRPGASSEAGVWRLPGGADWYALALRSNTTVTTPPEEMHRLGLDTFAQLSAELDALLKAQGFTQGSTAERVKALDHDPRLLKPDTDAGRAEILQFAREHLASLHGRLPRAFRTLPDRNITVERIPVAIEAGAPGAYYAGPPADGSRPGVISINLKTTTEWPTWRLKTLLHHEGDPGHHLQNSVFRRAAGPGLPLYKQFAQFSSYVEGWALYAEQVAIEIGAYEGDAFGHIGAVQSALFRRRGSSWTPASTTSAGPGPRRRAGWSRRQASSRRRPSAKSTATASIPARPAPSWSAPGADAHPRRGQGPAWRGLRRARLPREGAARRADAAGGPGPDDGLG